MYYIFLRHEFLNPWFIIAYCNIHEFPLHFFEISFKIARENMFLLIFAQLSNKRRPNSKTTECSLPVDIIISYSEVETFSATKETGLLCQSTYKDQTSRQWWGLWWRRRNSEIRCQTCHHALHSSHAVHVGGCGHYQLYRILHHTLRLLVSVHHTYYSHSCVSWIC